MFVFTQRRSRNKEKAVQTSYAFCNTHLLSVHSLHTSQIARNQQAAADLKNTLTDMEKDKADRFDTMFDEEVNKIRLDEAGWKAR